MIKSRLVIYRGKEVVQGPEYKRLGLMMVNNLGLQRLELKSKTKVKKPNLIEVERRAVMKSLILTIKNVAHVLACMRKMFYLVWDASSFSVPTLDGSTKTVWRIIQ